MPYIGNTSPSRFVSNRAASVYSGDGSTTAFTLEQAVVQDEDILVSVDGVVQEPSVAYAVSNATTLTFTAAPSSNSGNNIFVYYLASQVGTVGHPSNQALSATSGTFSTDLTVSGNTGIGETSPLGKLHVKSGDSAASSVSGNANELVVENSDYTGITILGENEASIMFGDNEDPDVGRIVYFHGTNTMSFMTNANNAMHIDSTGAITKPLQPAFQARPSSNQNNNGTDTVVDIALGTEVFDVGSDFASNTFTAPVTGKYALKVQVRLDNLDSASSYYRIDIITSNRNYYYLFDPDFGQDQSYWTISNSVIADMDAGDTAKIAFLQDGSGAAQTDIFGSSEGYTLFSGYLVA